MKSPYSFKHLFHSLLNKALQHVLIYKHRYRSRKALLVLDDRMLEDIGISKENAKQEGERYFWQGNSNVFDTNEYSRLKQRLYPAKQAKSRGVSLF